MDKKIYIRSLRALEEIFRGVARADCGEVRILENLAGSMASISDAFLYRDPPEEEFMAFQQIASQTFERCANAVGDLPVFQDELKEMATAYAPVTKETKKANTSILRNPLRFVVHGPK
ncbi:MAG: hypothetical protein H6853_02475 [Rhodospirillales bacterium]|nr:hypothetical protein [Alphaproteobacteria bacterium]USO04158.1 MAG: hypothetical protein H6853_02475 [Rhodospirillales bacterium]